MYKDQVEDMLEAHVFPAFTAAEGYIRARVSDKTLATLGQKVAIC